MGIVGKTNTGKTTFFNAATLSAAKVSTYPFTTKTPNSAAANVLTPCVCREFKVKDNPKNSACVEGWREVPVELIDLPGLIKGAWEGKGLGNRFLSVAASSDALLHVVDASGSVDPEGKITEAGTGDPVLDVLDIEEELVKWLWKVIQDNHDRITREIKSGAELAEAMTAVLSGSKVTESHVGAALKMSRLNGGEFTGWSSDDLLLFSEKLRQVSKPTLIVANKMDLASSAENFKRLQDEFPDTIIVPCSAEAELALRRAEARNLIRYVPGEERFEVLDQSRLSEKQRWALSHIRTKVLGEYMRTGVQFSINVAVFKLLRMNAVYPVYDPKRLSDKRGNVLPDVFLLPSGSTVTDLAGQIHSDLARGLLFALDARTGLRLPAQYQLKDRDVLNMVSTARKPKAKSKPEK